MKKNISRRQLLIASSVAVPGLLLSTRLIAAENLDMSDPQAKALGYAEDAGAVDTTAWPRKQPDQTCANCALYTGEATGFGPCSIFAGKDVAAAGWCNVWAPKS